MTMIFIRSDFICLNIEPYSLCILKPPLQDIIVTLHNLFKDGNQFFHNMFKLPKLLNETIEIYVFPDRIYPLAFWRYACNKKIYLQKIHLTSIYAHISWRSNREHQHDVHDTYSAFVLCILHPTLTHMIND